MPIAKAEKNEKISWKRQLHTWGWVCDSKQKSRKKVEADADVDDV